MSPCDGGRELHPLRKHHKFGVGKNINEEVYHDKDVMMLQDVVVGLFDVELLCGSSQMWMSRAG